MATLHSPREYWTCDICGEQCESELIAIECEKSHGEVYSDLDDFLSRNIRIAYTFDECVRHTSGERFIRGIFKNRDTGELSVAHYVPKNELDSIEKFLYTD